MLFFRHVWRIVALNFIWKNWFEGMDSLMSQLYNLTHIKVRS